MILCLDVGNSHIFGGVFRGDQLVVKFRSGASINHTSDQYGVFLRSVLRENNIDYLSIKHISLCSVVPPLDYSLQAACRKYFDLTPFVLQPGVRTGLKIQYKNPQEVGADRIANAIAAVQQFPQQNTIVVDFGTATTICAISAAKAYLGGVILPGMKISMHALESQAAKLSPVAIVRPKAILGTTPAESIQSGLFFGQLATIREVTQKITTEYFQSQMPIIIGTGGFAALFTEENIFTVIIPDLVLHGLRLALTNNCSVDERKEHVVTG